MWWLSPGCIYQVTREFVDADGDAHLVGETWKLLGILFDKMYNEVILVLTVDGTVEKALPLEWTIQKHADVIEHSNTYLKVASAL
jgi:hypothetical protein